MITRKGRTAFTTVYAAGVAALLAACGGATGAPVPPAQGSGAADASPTAAATPSATAAVAAFSCAIKPGAGLLPSQTAKPGRIVASIADIESATGLQVNQSVDVSMISGMTQCRYDIGQGGQVDITLLDTPGQAQAELAKTKSQNLALHDRGCNGCSLAGMTALSELGPDGYGGTTDGDPLFGSITAGTYFEVGGVKLKDVRLERLALVIAANLSGGASPSLPPLPTPTP
ncbi:MAG TPA: hypothetical protein VN193_10545 [Candidatus Angelobacter sp.]|nr:hypothetical protein [Candidatus Angelobacter sp.]